jgi:putative heme-binding domain-containing protein
VPVAAGALKQPASHLAAHDYLAELGSAEHAATVVRLAANARSGEVLTRTTRALELWRSASDPPLRDRLDDDIARLQGDSGVIVLWNVHGPLAAEAAAQLATRVHDPATPLSSHSGAWSRILAEAADARIDVARPADAPADSTWLACSDVFVAEPARVQFLTSGSGAFHVWLDGRSVHQRDKPAPYQLDSDRFEAQLDAGRHRLLVQLAATSDVVQLHARFRRLGSSAEHERLAQYVLQNSGNVDRGREVFLNADKSLCSKCHRIGDEGPRIGPDLSGIGSRFSRIHLIESILEPSRAIAPSYETISVALSDGRVLSGVKVTEDESTLTLADDQGRSHALPRSEIDERRPQPRSTMPDGLERRLSDRELLDLISYLVAQKKPSPP